MQHVSGPKQQAGAGHRLGEYETRGLQAAEAARLQPWPARIAAEDVSRASGAELRRLGIGKGTRTGHRSSIGRGKDRRTATVVIIIVPLPVLWKRRGIAEDRLRDLILRIIPGDDTD